MKSFPISRILFLLATVLFAFSACVPDTDDDLFDDERPPVQSNTELRLDGPNATAPLLNAGTHRFAVQFYEDDLDFYDGEALLGVRIFLQDAAPYMSISAHEGGTQTPGSELARIDVEGSISESGFYDFEFDSPIRISAEQPLWLVVEVELDERQPTVGCDNGPNKAGGDWLWSSGRYLTFRERSGDSINWNIRGIIGE